MNTYLGIDPSLMCTGLCLLDRSMHVVSYKAIAFKAGDPNRLLNYNKSLFKFLKKYEPKFVGLEAYAYGKSGMSMAFNIGELGGSLKVAIQKKGIKNVIRPLPTEVKRFVAGEPRAEKEEVREILEGEYKYELKWSRKDQLLDLYDALAIALITYYFYRRKKREELHQQQRDILRNIDLRVRKEQLKISR